VNSNLDFRRVGIATVALGFAVGLTACGASNEDDGSSGGSGGDAAAGLSGTLNGAGASSQEAAMAAWQAGFQGANPDVTVNYDAVGSGGGREQFLAGGVSFAGSDSYLDDDELSSSTEVCGDDGAYEFPVYVSPIAVIYNLPGVEDLRLSPDALAGIFAGEITAWDDEAIAADNPDADLPDSAITPVHRSDESGTTANFTDFLGQVAGDVWTHGSIEAWPVKGGEGADGTSGVVSAVTEGKGTIGYADASQASSLSHALVGVGSDFVGPTPEAAAAVLDESTPISGRGEHDGALEINRTTDAAGVYPIILASYHIVCSSYADQETVDLVQGFESYVISEDGQNAAASEAGSAPITDSIREQAQAAIDAITVQ